MHYEYLLNRYNFNYITYWKQTKRKRERERERERERIIVDNYDLQK